MRESSRNVNELSHLSRTQIWELPGTTGHGFGPIVTIANAMGCSEALPAWEADPTTKENEVQAQS
jgi:hypothetical protein